MKLVLHCTQGLVMGAALLTTLSASGQAAQVALAYDAVSIKPNKSGSGSINVDINNDQFNATNITLKMLIQRAWHLPTEDLISGLPAWANSAHFDVKAKVDEETIAMLTKVPREQREMQSETMMQGLLADRFQLKIHPETKELPVFHMVIAKGGLRMKETMDDSHGRSLHTNNQRLTATDLPMASFALYLSEQMHRKVEDKTGLPSHYDFTLQWSIDEASGDKAPEFPPLMTALEEQLGLKLTPAKGPVDTIVVDRIEQPTEN